MKIRCSSLPKICTASKVKGALSETAKSYIKTIAKQDFYGYETELNNKYVKKGIECVGSAILLYNNVFFTTHEKNKERKSTEIITGECDIITPELIIDIKCSWSFETFPATSEEITLKDYEYQLRGYMYLYEVNSAELAYCMVDTPDHLIGYDNVQIHKTINAPIESLVTTLRIERDEKLETEMIEKVHMAHEYYSEYINKINLKNK